MPIDEIAFAVSCSATVTDEFELQLTKTCDKARNWMTMFHNWSTKDEIETSIRTFQSVRDEIENTFSKLEWRDDENGRENLYYFINRCSTSKRPYHLTYQVHAFQSLSFSTVTAAQTLLQIAKGYLVSHFCACVVLVLSCSMWYCIVCRVITLCCVLFNSRYCLNLWYTGT